MKDFRNPNARRTNQLNSAKDLFQLHWGGGVKDKAAIAEMSQAIARSTHTHTQLPQACVCLAANVIAVLTALVNSSAQNELSGSVGSLL